jgi:hypothetical protein
MKQARMLLGAVLLFALGAGAQTTTIMSPRLTDSAPIGSQLNPRLFALASPNAAAEPSSWRHNWIPRPGVGQPIYGVFPDFNWQVYGGFTYTRFYEFQGTTADLAGFDFAITYYPHIRWIAAEGDISATFGSQAGQHSQLVTEMGGIRLRWPERDSNVWVHGLAGGAYLAPKTVYGGQHAFSYEIGAGVDLARRRSRVSYRVEGDIVGTFFFGTYQYSPKVSAGLAYSF